MNEKFVASNGAEIEVSPAGSLSIDRVTLFPRDFSIRATEALREFFLAERDEELGRWRDPKQPDFVVYPRRTLSDGTRQASVVNERAGAAAYVTEGDPLDMEARVVAARYFAAHPEPKPWHDAKEGEVWELTSTENYAYKPGLWAVVSEGKFVFKSAFGSGFDRIYLESDWEWERVYPDLDSEDDN